MSAKVGVNDKDGNEGDLLFLVAPTGSLSAISLSCLESKIDTECHQHKITSTNSRWLQQNKYHKFL